MTTPALHPLTLYRQARGLTLLDLAELARTTKGTISRIENGTRHPSIALLRAIVAATCGEVSADEIINFRHATREPV